MSTFETKTADNFIFSELHDPRDQDSLSTPFLRKNVSYVVDQQAGNGSYNSPEVIIDSQAIASSGNAIDWRNAYLAVPFQTKWETTFGASGGTLTGASGLAKVALSIKNNSLVDQLKVEANGKTILTANTGLAKLVNFKMLSTMSYNQLQKDGSLLNFWPDDVGQLADSNYDNSNVANDILTSTVFGDIPIQANRGLIQRQSNWLPQQQSTVLNQANCKEDGYAYDAGTGSVSTAAATTNPSDIHWVAIIRLRDLADYFDKHPVARGVSYRFTIRFNQAVTTIDHGSTATSFASGTVTTAQTSGTAQPAQLCAAGIGMLSRLSWATGVQVTSRVTHVIDTDSTNQVFAGVRLYVPSYELDPEHQKMIMESPKVQRNFLDYTIQTSQAITSGSFFNVQVSTSCTNPRALVVIPRVSSSDTTQSPYTCTPGCTDAFLALRQVQVKVGSNYVLPDRTSYGFQHYIDNVASIFALNGGQTNITSGLIDKRGWETLFRYYAFDLSRYPEVLKDLPQMVSVEGYNNTQQSIILDCYLLYGRDAEWDFATGSMNLTA